MSGLSPAEVEALSLEFEQKASTATGEEAELDAKPEYLDDNAGLDNVVSSPAGRDPANNGPRILIVTLARPSIASEERPYSMKKSSKPLVTMRMLQLLFSGSSFDKDVHKDFILTDAFPKAIWNKEWEKSITDADNKVARAHVDKVIVDYKVDIVAFASKHVHEAMQFGLSKEEKDKIKTKGEARFTEYQPTVNGSTAVVSVYTNHPHMLGYGNGDTAKKSILRVFDAIRSVKNKKFKNRAELKETLNAHLDAGAADDPKSWKDVKKSLKALDSTPIEWWLTAFDCQSVEELEAKGAHLKPLYRLESKKEGDTQSLFEASGAASRGMDEDSFRIHYLSSGGRCSVIGDPPSLIKKGVGQMVMTDKYFAAVKAEYSEAK